jgi:hypothetical protein
MSGWPLVWIWEIWPLRIAFQFSNYINSVLVISCRISDFRSKKNFLFLRSSLWLACSLFCFQLFLFKLLKTGLFSLLSFLDFVFRKRVSVLIDLRVRAKTSSKELTCRNDYFLLVVLGFVFTFHIFGSIQRKFTQYWIFQ